MIDKIKKLEEKAAILEPDSNTRANVRDQIIDYSESIIQKSSNLDVKTFNADNDGSGINTLKIQEEGRPIDLLLETFDDNVAKPGINPASHGHIAYIPGGGVYNASLGDYLAAISNEYAGVYYASPGAVRIENMLIRWMSNIIGYPSSSAGYLASGGSISNLTAIVTAREAKNIKAREVESSVIYVTNQAHHSIKKAIGISGLSEARIRKIAIDDNSRMIAKELEDQIKLDIQSGLKPFLVIASAGTTDTGAVDPLEAIAKIATTYDLWFHVDAAYGGFFILCDEGKKILKGLELSDSITMDPHKGLFLPYGIGALLVKDKNHLFAAHHFEANYMQDAIDKTEELSPSNLSPELTKHFRGLRMWLPLQLHGVKPFRACVEEKILLARYAFDKLNKIDGFEMGSFPDLSIVTFRYIPDTVDINEFNTKLNKYVNDDGRIFLSSTIINNKVILRFAILSFRTHIATIDLAIAILQEGIQKLSAK